MKTHASTRRNLGARIDSVFPGNFSCQGTLLSFFVSAIQLMWVAALPGGPLPTEEPQVEYVIVVTGRELLTGVYADGHTLFLTRTLRPLGLQCVGSMSVDDSPSDIQKALEFATREAPLVLVTGGLGPTDNDVTRETLARFTDIPLEEQPEVVRDMERRFGKPREQLRQNLLRQTRVPTRGTYLQNPRGTSVGLAFEMGDQVIVALPGPPSELQPMVVQHLLPYLKRRFGTRMPGCTLTVRFVGLGQSTIDKTLKDHIELPSDLTLASQFEGGRVDFTFALPGNSPADRDRLQRLKSEILDQLGDYVYATDGTSLEEQVLKLLARRGQTLALVEVASGGSVGAALAAAAGGQRTLIGSWVAPDTRRLRRMLRVSDQISPQRAAASDDIGSLAEQVADVTGGDWSIVIGERTGGHISIAFRSPDGVTEDSRISVRGDGPLDRSRVTTEFLDQFRRRLQ